MSEHPESTLWPIARASGEVERASNSMVPLRAFSNALRILHSLDFHEIEATGFGGNWTAFRDDPARYFLRASDADAAAIWAAIKKRQPEPLKPRESA